MVSHISSIWDPAVLWRGLIGVPAALADDEVGRGLCLLWVEGRAVKVGAAKCGEGKSRRRCLCACAQEEDELQQDPDLQPM